MKAMIILAIGVVATVTSVAQNKPVSPMNSYIYQVDAQNFCRVEKGTPGSDVLFYSDVSGGKMIKSATLDNTGGLQIAEAGFNPAFVINSDKRNAQNIAGSGRLIFTGDKEFTLKDMQLDCTDKAITVRWNATANIDKGISFELLKSYDGISYQKAGDVLAYSHGLPADYSFTETKEVSGISYKIQVKNNKAGVRYLSDAFVVRSTNQILVYPSFFTNDINVDIPNNDHSAYRVSNLTGQTVKSGSLSAVNNKVSLSDLPGGTYIIHVIGKDAETSKKIVKQ